VPAF
jgi:hypothetical protein